MIFYSLSLENCKLKQIQYVVTVTLTVIIAIMLRGPCFCAAQQHMHKITYEINEGNMQKTQTCTKRKRSSGKSNVVLLDAQENNEERKNATTTTWHLFFSFRFKSLKRKKHVRWTNSDATTHLCTHIRARIHIRPTYTEHDAYTCVCLPVCMRNDGVY